METKTENTNIGIHFGALADPLVKQIKDQGFKYDEDKMKVFQKELDAITQLRFGTNILTDSMVDKCYAKLHKAIVAHVAKANGRKVIKK